MATAPHITDRLVGGEGDRRHASYGRLMPLNVAIGIGVGVAVSIVAAAILIFFFFFGAAPGIFI